MNVIRPKQSRGFTLVEVAVVLFFMGIFVSFAASMMKNIALSNKLRDARDKLTVVSDAVQSWANKNRRLPTVATGPENFDTVLSQPLDYWNKKYTFYPYAPVTGATDNNICRQTSTNLAICPGTKTVANCSVGIIRDVAYLLVSSGDNLAFETLPAVTNCPAGLTCKPKYEVSSGYDDLYKYVTLQELKKVVGCVEADSRLRILNSQLPQVSVGAAYLATIQADGGAPFNSTPPYTYNWCVKDLPAGLIATNTCPTYSTTPVSSFLISSPAAPNVLGVQVTISVKDANGATTDKSYLFEVNP